MTTRSPVIDTVRMLEFVLNCLELDDVELAKVTLRKEISKRRDFLHKTPLPQRVQSTPVAKAQSGGGAPPVPARNQKSSVYESVVIEDEEASTQPPPPIPTSITSNAPTQPPPPIPTNKKPVFDPQTIKSSHETLTINVPPKTKARSRGSVISLNPTTSQSSESHNSRSDKKGNLEKRLSWIADRTNESTIMKVLVENDFNKSVFNSNSTQTPKSTLSPLKTQETPEIKPQKQQEQKQNQPPQGRNEKQQKNFDMIVAEIMQTEKDYVRDLQIVTEVRKKTKKSYNNFLLFLISIHV